MSNEVNETEKNELDNEEEKYKPTLEERKEFESIMLQLGKPTTAVEEARTQREFISMIANAKKDLNNPAVVKPITTINTEKKEIIVPEINIVKNKNSFEVLFLNEDEIKSTLKNISDEHLMKVKELVMEEWNDRIKKNQEAEEEVHQALIKLEKIRRRSELLKGVSSKNSNNFSISSVSESKQLISEDSDSQDISMS